MNISNLRNWHTLTWLFRAEVQDNFPTPDARDSLAFAVTEAGEAIKALHDWPEFLDAAYLFASNAVDAQLRLNLHYRRNAEKTHSVERELCQCAMMLLTAVPATYRDWDSLDDYPFMSTWTVRNIAVRVGNCLEVPSDIAYILGTVAAISTAVDLDTSLPAEWDRMRAKHGQPTVYPQADERIVIVADGGHDSTTYTLTARETASPPLGLNFSEWWDEEPVRSLRYVLRDYREGDGLE